MKKIALFLLTMGWLSSVAIAAPKDDIAKAIEDLQAQDVATIQAAAEALPKLVSRKTLNQDDRRKLVDAAVQALRYLSWRWSDEKIVSLDLETTMQASKCVVDMLSQLAPFNSRVIARLLRIYFPDPKGLHLANQGEVPLPHDIYLNSIAKHKPWMLLPSLASRRSSIRLSAALYLMAANEFSETMYWEFIRPILPKIFSGSIKPGFGDLASLFPFGSGSNPGTVAYLFKQDLMKLTEDFIENTLPLKMDMIGYVFALARIGYQDPLVIERLQVIYRAFAAKGELTDRDHSLLLDGIRMAQGTLRKTVADLDYEHHIRKINFAINIINTGGEDAGALASDQMGSLASFVDALFSIDADDRRMYLEDVVRNGGDALGKIVVEKLLEKGGPDLRAELMAIPVCRRLFGED